MARKYRNKNKKKGLITGLLIGLVGMGCVGAVGALSHGFQDWTFDFGTQEKEDTRNNLRVIDLKTENSTSSAMVSSALISYLNGGLEDGVDPIFSDIAYVEKEVDETTTKEYLIQSIYKGEGGIKFGTTSTLGSFTVNLVDSYSFNCAKVIGRNYSVLGNNDVYSCDKSSIVVNGAEAQVFGTNEEDTSKIAPLEEKTFKFDDLQKQLSISVLGKRAIIYTIELWTE